MKLTVIFVVETEGCRMVWVENKPNENLNKPFQKSNFISERDFQLADLETENDGIECTVPISKQLVVMLLLVIVVRKYPSFQILIDVLLYCLCEEHKKMKPP